MVGQIHIPSAERHGEANVPSPDHSRRPGWLVPLIVASLLVVLGGVTSGLSDGGVEQPEDVLAPAERRTPLRAGDLERLIPTAFPGSGRFDVILGTDPVVLAGSRPLDLAGGTGAMAWSRSPRGWEEVALPGSGVESRVTSGAVFAGQALLGGFSGETSALWQVEGGVARVLPGPVAGSIASLATSAERLYAVTADPVAVWVTSDLERWVDVTPPGVEVLHSVAVFDEMVVAAGADLGGPALWIAEDGVYFWSDATLGETEALPTGVEMRSVAQRGDGWVASGADGGEFVQGRTWFWDSSDLYGWRLRTAAAFPRTVDRVHSANGVAVGSSAAAGPAADPLVIIDERSTTLAGIGRGGGEVAGLLFTNSGVTVVGSEGGRPVVWSNAPDPIPTTAGIAFVEVAGELPDTVVRRFGESVVLAGPRGSFWWRDGRLVPMFTDDDEALWILGPGAEAGAGIIVTAVAAGEVALWSIDSDGTASFVCCSGDGPAWVAPSRAGVTVGLGRPESALGISGWSPDAVSVDIDGNVWVTEASGEVPTAIVASHGVRSVGVVGERLVGSVDGVAWQPLATGFTFGDVAAIGHAGPDLVAITDDGWIVTLPGSTIRGRFPVQTGGTAPMVGLLDGERWVASTGGPLMTSDDGWNWSPIDTGARSGLAAPLLHPFVEGRRLFVHGTDGVTTTVWEWVGR